MSIADNCASIQNQLGPQAQLVAVTKNRSPQEIDAIIETGITIIGENRIQEAQEKFPKFTHPIKKHFIGHLQTNKTKIAVQLFDMIESVDSVRLAQKINEEAEKQGKNMPILLQINIAEDLNKYGIHEKELEDALKMLEPLSHIEVVGLMTIVPYYDDPEEARPHFQKMRRLKEKFGLKELSMGMSNDYKIAIQEGATLVRIGRALFD